jgi:hypothetical protein
MRCVIPLRRQVGRSAPLVDLGDKKRGGTQTATTIWHVNVKEKREQKKNKERLYKDNNNKHYEVTTHDA